MRIYDFSDYKIYVSKRINQMPGKGRGIYKRIAEILEIHSSLVTHIFKGDKDLTPEQAFLLSEYFALDPLESNYFTTLVTLRRANRQTYRKHLLAKLESIKKDAMGSHGSDEEPSFDDTQKTIFYSNWSYCGVHLMTTIQGFNTVDAIATRLQLSPSNVRRVLEFLVQTGLCESVDGKYRAKKFSTTIKDSRHLSVSHNTNWRFKAVERLPRQNDSDFFFTNLVSLSAGDAAKIKQLLTRSMNRVRPIVKKSPAETVFCLNVDWFGI